MIVFDLLPTLVGYHDGQSGHGTSGSVIGMVAVLGVLATAGWLLFSTLSFRLNVGIAAAVWVAGLIYLLVS